MAKGKNGAAKSRGSRKSKAESMTGAKEAAAEVRKADSAELGLVIEDGDFDLHLRAIKGAVDRQKTAKSLYDSCCKAAKKVSPQLLDAVKRAIKFQGMDVEDIKAQLEIDGYVLRRTGSSIQLTLHDTLLGDEKELAYKRGNEAGKCGQPCASKYPEGSDLDAEYRRGWQHGAGSNLGLSDDETDAAIATEHEEVVEPGIGHNADNKEPAELLN
jgi:hypothetical protein